MPFFDWSYITLALDTTQSSMGHTHTHQTPTSTFKRELKTKRVEKVVAEEEGKESPVPIEVRSTVFYN